MELNLPSCVWRNDPEKAFILFPPKLATERRPHKSGVDISNRVKGKTAILTQFSIFTVIMQSSEYESSSERTVKAPKARSGQRNAAFTSNTPVITYKRGNWSIPFRNSDADASIFSSFQQISLWHRDSLHHSMEAVLDLIMLVSCMARSLWSAMLSFRFVDEIKVMLTRLESIGRHGKCCMEERDFRQKISRSILPNWIKGSRQIDHKSTNKGSTDGRFAINSLWFWHGRALFLIHTSASAFVDLRVSGNPYLRCFIEEAFSEIIWNSSWPKNIALFLLVFLISKVSLSLFSVSFWADKRRPYILLYSGSSWMESFVRKQMG